MSVISHSFGISFMPSAGVTVNFLISFAIRLIQAGGIFSREACCTKRQMSVTASLLNKTTYHVALVFTGRVEGKVSEKRLQPFSSRTF